MIASGKIKATVVAQVASDIISIYLVQVTDIASTTQANDQFGNVSQVVSSPQLKVWNSDLRKLGILNQRIRGI